MRFAGERSHGLSFGRCEVWCVGSTERGEEPGWGSPDWGSGSLGDLDASLTSELLFRQCDCKH